MILGMDPMTCRHHWICSKPVYKGNVMVVVVTKGKCKLCLATREFRTEYRAYGDFAVGTRPLEDRLGVW